jgi:hypothetical protein
MADPANAFSQGAYFLGKALWTKVRASASGRRPTGLLTPTPTPTPTPTLAPTLTLTLTLTPSQGYRELWDAMPP